MGPGQTIRSMASIDGGRGMFSHVWQCTLDGAVGSVAVKMLRADSNGEAAITSGAVAREVLAYQTILPATPLVSAPHCFGITNDADGHPAFVFEDLSAHHTSDQLDGLDNAEVRAVTLELIALHEAWSEHSDLDRIEVRRATPASLPDAGIERGLDVLDSEWASIDPTRRSALRRLADHRSAPIDAFVDEGGTTLCHGDPRADNVMFDDNGRAVLFDWQQMAIQFGEADLAWLLATSVTPERRRTIESDVVASYAIARGQDAVTTWRRYVLGMVLPGLAVLFLAQRQTSDPRSRALVETSIDRIATAVDDLGVAALSWR
jgi:aminoglycoside phosphotransferase (APT) family kinase protein